MNYLQHRQCRSQEFAVDVLKFSPDGQLATSKKPNSASLSDYFIYREPVLASGDGVVVEVRDAFPEQQTLSPKNWSAETANKIITDLSQTIGWRNALAGNFITIKHKNGEYSFYAHLSQHSMKVKVGDKVKAGQEIALVGSTGNSSEPHLHFQLMDSMDFETANGLPIRFEDIPADKLDQNFVDANSISSSDSLYLSLPKVTNR